VNIKEKKKQLVQIKIKNSPYSRPAAKPSLENIEKNKIGSKPMPMKITISIGEGDTKRGKGQGAG